MANIFTSSIGKKLIMSITGLFLIIFLLLHLTINFFSVIDSCTGNFVAGNTDGLFALGCEFMSTPIITVMVPILALGFIIHIIYATYLTWSNIRTRGGYNRYEVASKAKAESWAAKNMFALGIIVLGFIVFHLTHFWDEMQLKEFMGQEAADPYTLRFLERIPDHRLEQPDMGKETQGHRLHFRDDYIFRIYYRSNQCLYNGIVENPE